MIRKNNINVLITGCGAPGISGTVYSLKQENKFVNINIIGTDINPDAVGKFFCDIFYVIPSFNQKKEYLKKILEICDSEKISVIIPQNTLELEILSTNKEIFDDQNIKLLLSKNKSIQLSNNKNELMKVAQSINIPYPKFSLVDNIYDLEKSIKNLGWPKNKVVVKPPISNGSRGVRIIDEEIDLKSQFFNEKPGSLSSNFEALKLILGEQFDELLVMEFLDGEEYTVDVMRTSDKKIVIPRLRGSIKSGITFFGKIEKNDLIKDYSLKLADAINLEYCFGFQFKLKNQIPYIIECNPRVQGSMVISTLGGANIILNSILSILDLKTLEMNLDYSTTFTRYWGGIAINNQGKKII
tara:strand:- start:1219 stop:2283 length:1065 start_codon:yes stop_codon:yes gene_type:complete